MARRRRPSGSRVHGRTRFPRRPLPHRRPDRGTGQSAFYSPGSPASRRQTGCTPATAATGRSPLHQHIFYRTLSLPACRRIDTLQARPASPSAFRPLSPDTRAAHQTPPASTGSRPPASQTGGTRPSARRHAAKSLSTPDAARPFSAP